MFLRWAEIIFLLVAIILLLTQVAWPLVRGTKLLPIFRRESKLEQELENRRQQDLERELELEIGRTPGSKRRARGVNQRNATKSEGEDNV